MASLLPYLGVRLTPKYEGLYQANFTPLFRKPTDMLSSWSHLPLSRFGRIAAVSMSYLPKLLYFFQVLPVSIPSHILRIHQSKLLKVIWGSIRPRINKRVLYSRRISGGLSVPNLQACYTAATIAPLSHLYDTYQLPLWATMDLVDSHPIPISLTWLPSIHRLTRIGPCLKHSLHLWDC